MLARTPLAGYLGCCAAIRDADLRADDAAIRCPTLVIVGKEDLATPPSAAAELRDAIAGARLVELDAAAHIPTIERPDAVIAALTEFLAGAAG
jgi:pimeloyl-ACP methyl ester carboxylesterase